jgi:hypothetical protein
MNIILRHFIEVFIVSLWIDIGSQFTGGFDYFLESRKWKQHIKHYRIFWDNGKNPVRSIKQRLVRIKMLNSSRGHGTRFYKNYLSDASETDLRLLLSLPICNECKVKQKKDDFKGAYSRYYITTNVTKKGKEDKKAKYKTDFHFTCNFCYKQKPTKSYAMGVPDISDMIDMLKQILADRFIINLGFIQKIYSYLSDEFVHFATSITPDQKPSLQEFGSGNAKAVLWGLKGVIFCLDILKPLIEDYFEAKTKIY